MSIVFVFTCVIYPSAESLDAPFVDSNGVEHKVVDGTYVATMSEDVLSGLKQAGTSTYSLNGSDEGYEEILRMVGHDDQSLAAMGREEINYIMERAQSISTSTTYYMTDEMGNTSPITQEEYAVGQEEQAVATLSNGGSGQRTFDNGYFRIVTTATYIDPEEMEGQPGWFMVSSTFTFTGTMPAFRSTDACSLYCAEFTWAQYDSHYYSRMYYDFKDASGNVYSDYETQYGAARNDAQGGFYYEWTLPYDFLNGTKVRSVTAISIYLRGTGKISEHTDPQTANMHAKYEHIYYAMVISPSFGWTVWEKPGVSADATFASSVKTYAFNAVLNYEP